MATLYIFDGIDEKKQKQTADRYAKAGLTIYVHYHHAWKDGEERIPCNQQCYVIVDDEPNWLTPKE